MNSAAERTAAVPHVALLAFPFGSHSGALLALARALAAAAPGTVFSFLSSARSIAALAPTVAGMENLRFHAVTDGCPSPPPANVEEQIGLFLRAAPGNLREGMAAAEAATGAALSCVVSDAFLSMSADVAEEMGVPWVPLWPGGPASLLAHLHVDLLRRTIGVGDQAISGRADETLHFIPGLSAMRVRDLPEGIVSGDLESGFSLLLHRMAGQLPRAAALALNTFEGMDPAVDAALKAKFKYYLPVGPTNLLAPPPAAAPDDPSGCLPWLDRQQGPAAASVAYISFGTIMSLPPAELAELAEGLEASGVPFLWSLKEGLWAHLPAGFLDRTKERGLVVPWTPQVRVLAHAAVGASVTHCGWNSVLESVSSGVPMVCRPLFGDHPMIRRTVSEVLGIGVGFEGGAVTREAVVSSLNMILKEEEGRRMRERIHALKAVAEGAVGPGGSSTENLNRLVEIVCGR